jgi:hypothetical protein
MTDFVVINGHRYFDDDCQIVGHEIGDRHRNPGALDIEWDGQSWAPVCPTDDVAMRDRDEQGWLRCGVCLVRAGDVR